MSTPSDAPLATKYVPPHMRNRPQNAAPAADAPPRDTHAGSGGRFDSRDGPRDGPRDSHGSRPDFGGRFGSRDVRENMPRHESRFSGRDGRDGHSRDGPSRDSYSRDGPPTTGSERFSREALYSTPSYGGSRGGRFREPRLEDRNARLEAELYGEVKTGIEFKNYEDIPVETSGHDIPPPVESYKDLTMLHPVIADNIALCGYDHPTPVQKHGIAVTLAGRDLMACAQTGSGKTAAFLLPTIQRLLQMELDGQAAPRDVKRTSTGRSVCYPQALVLAPTRELATQIFNESRKFVYRTGLKPVVVYGGVDIRNQLRELGHDTNLLIATPGRLVDLLERGRVSMSNIRFLIFDEADRMLDMGFEPQIRLIVENSDMGPDRQTLMFSATFPKEIQRLAQDFLQDYVFLAVGRVGSTTDFITQRVEATPHSEHEKLDRLMNILAGSEGLTLIFVETKRGADYLENALVREGIEATSIHGDRTQQERETSLQWFRCGRCPVLVATDVASRGLDIPDVRCVVNYDLPNNIDDYVHRIGRTGRAGKKGTAIAFVSDKNRPILRDLFDLMKENKQELPSWFESLALGGGSFGGGGRYGGHGGGNRHGGGRSFGGRDFRRDDDKWAGQTSHSNMGAKGAGAGGPPRQQAPPQQQQQSSFGIRSGGRGGNYGDSW